MNCAHETEGDSSASRRVYTFFGFNKHLQSRDVSRLRTFFRKLRRFVPWDNTVPGGCRFPCIVIVTLYIEQKIQEREEVKATGGNIYM